MRFLRMAGQHSRLQNVIERAVILARPTRCRWTRAATTIAGGSQGAGQQLTEAVQAHEIGPHPNRAGGIARAGCRAATGGSRAAGHAGLRRSTRDSIAEDQQASGQDHNVVPHLTVFLTEYRKLPNRCTCGRRRAVFPNDSSCALPLQSARRIHAGLGSTHVENRAVPKTADDF